jgi:flagellar biosynthesis protein FlhF
MKIKRYAAASMRAALGQVREEQGPDAVILSSRRMDEGVEVIAAVDYDETLMAEASRRHASAASAGAGTLRAAPAAEASAPAAEAPVARAESSATGAGVAASRNTPRPGRAAATRTQQPATAAAAAEPGFGSMQRELQDLRHLLENELATLTWNDKRLREPLKVRVLEELSALDIASDVAAALAARTPQHTRLENPSHIPLALLVKHLPVVNDMSCVTGGIVAVVGPTGVGKTTTIAKLAARWSMLHGSQDLALVSTDGYRIGAREQLLTYARILGAPLHSADTGTELAHTLARLQNKKLVLIDTAGIGPRDIRLTEQLAALKLGAARARVLLALPAQGEAHALEEIVRAFAGIAPAACVLTKLDEAASLGAVLSTTLRHKLPIAYLCDGQRVPEDLHAAENRRVWLIRMAVRLKERLAVRPDDAYLARKFGRGHAHA